MTEMGGASGSSWAVFSAMADSKICLNTRDFLIESGKLLTKSRMPVGRSDRQQYAGEGMSSLMEMPEGVDERVPESCFMSLAMVMQCEWVLDKQINALLMNENRGNLLQHLP